MVHAGDRAAAIDRLVRVLDELEVGGIQTTLPFHRFVARHAGFRAARLSTGWVGEHWDGAAEYRSAARAAQLATGMAALADGFGLDGGSGSRRPVDPRSPGRRWFLDGLERTLDRWPR
jgi:acetyl/propionyl-CoA carboxylase alpha subunit